MDNRLYRSDDVSGLGLRGRDQGEGVWDLRDALGDRLCFVTRDAVTESTFSVLKDTSRGYVNIKIKPSHKGHYSGITKMKRVHK